MEERSAETSAQRYLRTVDELDDVIAVKERVQAPNRGLADNCRSMNANKLLRVEFLLQILNRLPRNVVPGCRVNHDVFVRRFDPEDLVNWYENKTTLHPNGQPGEPAAFITVGSISSDDPPVRALQGHQKPFLVERLTEIIDRLDLKGAHPYSL